ncbi:hypothetical protein [Gemmatimonas aurantiaca]|uniref:hypothetical protein n=1 Tax=Gemmatimonas aurantiaca TaxID=173480 RepID=UPI00301C0FEE
MIRRTQSGLNHWIRQIEDIRQKALHAKHTVRNVVMIDELIADLEYCSNLGQGRDGI